MKVLHLEDSVPDHTLARATLRSAGCPWEMLRVESLPAFTAAIANDDIDLVLADYQLPGFTALDAWNAVPDSVQRPPFVLLSGAIGEAAAVAAIQQGFADYLNKSELQRLPHIAQRALEFAEHLRAKQLADAALAESRQQLAQLNTHLQELIEQERLAIAREVHDDIGGALTAAKFDLAWLLRRDLSDDVRDHTASAQAGVQAAIDASRRLMLNLRPSILDEGLAPAIRWLVDDFSRRHQIPVTVHMQDLQIPLSAQPLLVAFRVAQEALTNVAKHAQCTQVHMDVSSFDSVLTVEITDNGKGMDKNDTRKAHSFGLRGLEERAQSVGGWLDISSRPSTGTSIILSIPLHTTPDQPQESNP